MERFELRSKMQKKYELKNRQRITIKQLIEISENEKIDLKDLIMMKWNMWTRLTVGYIL